MLIIPLFVKRIVLCFNIYSKYAGKAATFEDEVNGVMLRVVLRLIWPLLGAYVGTDNNLRRLEVLFVTFWGTRLEKLAPVIKF